MIDEEMLAKVERLAGLDLTPKEREQLRLDLTKILAYFQKLQEVDTHGVPPFSPLPGQVNALREDEPEDSLPLEEVLRNAPEAVDGYILVPPLFPA